MRRLSMTPLTTCGLRPASFAQGWPGKSDPYEQLRGPDDFLSCALHGRNQHITIVNFQGSSLSTPATRMGMSYPKPRPGARLATGKGKISGSPKWLRYPGYLDMEHNRDLHTCVQLHSLSATFPRWEEALLNLG